MEDNKNEEMVRSEPQEKEIKPHKERSEEERERLKKLIVYPLMVLVFLCSMWLIFAPSSEDKEKEKQQQGFNTTMPTGNDDGLIADKRKAYENIQLEKKEDLRNQQMRDLSALFGTGEKEDVNLNLLPREDEETKPQSSRYGAGGGSVRPQASIQASASAYKDINATLGNFYEQPRTDPEKEQMQKELEKLRERVASERSERDVADDQLALLEKSYEIAAKYMPNQSNSSVNISSTNTSQAEKAVKEKVLERNGKALAMPVGQVQKRIVSSLYQSTSNEEFVRSYSKERNGDFHTAVGTETLTTVNTIKACIHEDKTLTDGQSIRLRLLEPMHAGKYILPKLTIVTGTVKIVGERLFINITSLEHLGQIIPVEVQVYDSDGQKGIFIPGSLELNAAKEIAANMGTSLGSSINISTDAGAQFASDLGKGLIQGTSQYISKKMRTVKIHLKAGYKVMLYQEEN